MKQIGEPGDWGGECLKLDLWKAVQLLLLSLGLTTRRRQLGKVEDKATEGEEG